MARRSPSSLIDRAKPRPAAAGIAAGTPVLTLDGALPVQFLAPGDRVITRSGARVLKGIEVTALSDACLLRISPRLTGDGAPHHLAPAQPLHLRDWRARAFCGRAAASVLAERLADGEFLRPEPVAEARLYVLRFEREEVIYAGGLELACAPAA